MDIPIIELPIPATMIMTSNDATLYHAAKKDIEKFDKLKKLRAELVERVRR